MSHVKQSVFSPETWVAGGKSFGFGFFISRSYERIQHQGEDRFVPKDEEPGLAIMFLDNLQQARADSANDEEAWRMRHEAENDFFEQSRAHRREIIDYLRSHPHEMMEGAPAY